MLVDMKTPGITIRPVIKMTGSHEFNQVFFDKSPPEIGVLTATWRQDGFVSLEAESLGGCSTLILAFSGSRLVLNSWTRFGGEIRVELADASNDNRRIHAPAFPDRAFEDCDPISGDHLDHVVTWKGESDLSAWSGHPVRLRFRMQRARLFSLRFA